MVTRFTLGVSPSMQDYYGIAFPGTTAAMTGRESLANNPYSGEWWWVFAESIWEKKFYRNIAWHHLVAS